MQLVVAGKLLLVLGGIVTQVTLVDGEIVPVLILLVPQTLLSGRGGEVALLAHVGSVLDVAASSGHHDGTAVCSVAVVDDQTATLLAQIMLVFACARHVAVLGYCWTVGADHAGGAGQQRHST